MPWPAERAWHPFVDIPWPAKGTWHLMRRPGESLLDYKKRVMDPISSSFCAAKWLSATIWLNKGMTVSCHIPSWHAIDPTHLAQDPSRLHNTDEKIKSRKQMLTGERPEECGFCWGVEDLSSSMVSERILSTQVHREEDVLQVSTSVPVDRAVPKILEIAFDNRCNFSCLYCNPDFSSAWARELKKYGPYVGLKSQDALTYVRNKEQLEVRNGEVFVKAFWDWWPELSQNLTELRITGGEPLLSPSFWKLSEYLLESPRQFKVAVNSNLCVGSKLLDRFFSFCSEYQSVDLYTSNEAYGKEAEYIRYGLNYKQWHENLSRATDQPGILSTNVMFTVNALSLFSMRDLLDELVTLKRGRRFNQCIMTFNILSLPAFLNIYVISQNTRRKIAKDLEEWLGDHASRLIELEVSSLQRLLGLLRDEPGEHWRVSNLELLRDDLKNFLTQADQRRGTDYKEILNQDFFREIN